MLTGSNCSLERIFGYTQIEQEPKPTEEGKPPAYWPASGRLEVSNLSARYSEDGPKVLEDITFKLESGQRVGVGMFLPSNCLNLVMTFGIVGRTGSGKVRLHSLLAPILTVFCRVR